MIKKYLLALPLLTTVACVATSLGTPLETAHRITAAVEAGDVEKAADWFERADNPEFRERMYPALYGKAAEYYAEGDTATASALLRLMHEHYNESDAVAEALLYSLFLERAREGYPRGSENSELDRVLADVLENDKTVPTWVDLVQTQAAIDSGDIERAREAFARFRLQGWQPSESDGELMAYVDDLGRYLANPPQGGSR